MATLPKEQVTQRNKTADVSITSGTQDNAAGEKLWLSTTTEPYTVVDTKSVTSTSPNQVDQDVLRARIDAAAPNATLNIYDQGVGQKRQALTKLGDTTATVVRTGTVSKDIEPFVAAANPDYLRYTIASSTGGFGTATMSGSVLVFAGNNSGAGSQVVTVTVSDSNASVNVVCTITVT